MSQWAGIRHLHLLFAGAAEGADARARAPGDGRGHRRLGSDRGTGGRGAAARRRHRDRRKSGLRPPLRRVSWPDRHRGAGRPAGRRTELADGAWAATGRRPPRCGTTCTARCLQPARLVDHGRGLRGGRLRALPQRSRRRGRPDRRCRASRCRTGTGSCPIRARTSRRRRSGTHSASSGCSTAPSSRPTWTDGLGKKHRRAVSVRMPDWVENPLGRYYPYFADHRGTYILACARDSSDRRVVLSIF